MGSRNQKPAIWLKIDLSVSENDLPELPKSTYKEVGPQRETHLPNPSFSGQLVPRAFDVE